jgi:ligand-binding SRPBCC domain-containing protein
MSLNTAAVALTHLFMFAWPSCTRLPCSLGVIHAWSIPHFFGGQADAITRGSPQFAERGPQAEPFQDSASNSDCYSPISVLTLPQISDYASPISTIPGICSIAHPTLGMRYNFHAEQWLPYPRGLVFAFFANPENLPRLMPRWQAARIEEAVFAPPPPRPAGVPRYPGIVAGAGTRLTISARPFPLSPVRAPWDALIEDFRWNEGFCDIQERGPFRYWRHCHSVHDAESPATGLPGVVVQDDVEYELPLPEALSGIADKLVVKLAMRKLFAFRQKRTTELLALMTGTAKQ